MDKQKFMLFSERKKLAEEYEKWINTPLDDGSKIKDCALSVITFMQIKGFCKIPEDAVVLTREENNKLCQKIGNLQYDKDILKQLEEENTDLKYDKFELKNEISEKDNKIALLEETIDCIKFNVDFTRKETAEKFAERLKAMAYQSTDWSHGEHPMVVEVDYIDEILEEITEGGR